MKSHNINIQYTELEVDELSGELLKLYQSAKKASQTAYAPYSKFHVGSALLMDDETVITGSNQENAAYPSGLCAERVALFFAGAHAPQSKVLVLMVYVPGVNRPAAPCGSCLQVMAETEDRQSNPFKVILANDERVFMMNDVQALLPFRFGKRNLLS